jgi:hypothetical protein
VPAAISKDLPAYTAWATHMANHNSYVLLRMQRCCCTGSSGRCSSSGQPSPPAPFIILFCVPGRCSAASRCCFQASCSPTTAMPSFERLMSPTLQLRWASAAVRFFQVSPVLGQPPAGSSRDIHNKRQHSCQESPGNADMGWGGQQLVPVAAAVAAGGFIPPSKSSSSRYRKQ